MKGLNHLCFADIIMVGSYKHLWNDVGIDRYITEDTV